MWEVQWGGFEGVAEESWTCWVFVRKDLKEVMERVSRLVSVAKMLRSSLRIIGEVILRGLELAPRLATPPPAPWGEVVRVAIVGGERGIRGCGFASTTLSITIFQYM